MSSSVLYINLLIYLCTPGDPAQKRVAALAGRATDTSERSIPFGLVGSFSGNAADAIAFHIWDCGGQPVFGALHSLFMSGRVYDVRMQGPIWDISLLSTAKTCLLPFIAKISLFCLDEGID